MRDVASFSVVILTTTKGQSWYFWPDGQQIQVVSERLSLSVMVSTVEGLSRSSERAALEEGFLLEPAEGDKPGVAFFSEEVCLAV